MDDDYLSLYGAMNDRITDLSKSYRVLNDHSQATMVRIVKLETKIDTTISIVKWFISPIAFVSLVLQILRIWNVI
jgi:hypothetical protein